VFESQGGPNKGLHFAGVNARMASSGVPPSVGDETELTEQLTERQSKILDYIRKVTRERSYPPSVR